MIYVGTAGWSIPSARQPDFPPGDSHLQRYAARMNAAEINSSFHRHHRRETYTRWAASVPDDFRFSVKVPRAFTHAGALAISQPTLDLFTDEVSGLGHKLGAALVQLPPKLAFEAQVVRRFFVELRRMLNVPFVCEPRHASWESSEANDSLVDLGVARVAADPPPWPGAGEPGGLDRLAYFRWHGQPRKYYSEYEAPSLAALRDQIAAVEARASSIWVIFDNTVLGHALSNAMTMAETLGSSRV